MNQEEFFKSCVKKQDLPRSNIEKQAVLQRIMQDFDKEVYKEEEVNQIVRQYFEDFALIRRELINFGYLIRYPIEGEYKVVKRKLSKQELEKIKKIQRHFEEHVY